MTKSRIAWTERVWNPVTGCTKVSAGCKNCYAERIAHRYWGERKFTDVQMHSERLGAPLHWRKPSRIFVNSMSDLFHESVRREFIKRVFGVMGDAHQHTFQVLTKRSERMRNILNTWEADGLCFRVGCGVRLPNAWIGVSAENQEQFEKRIQLLCETPAEIRWASLEPLLGAWDFDPSPMLSRLDWVVVGGESGPGFREMNLDALASIVAACKGAGVPVFVKQDSGLRPGQQGRIPNHLWIKEYPRGAHD
jgi:protein gp37